MPRQCKLCNKSPKVFIERKLLRGHYNPTKKSFKYPNLQWAVLPSGKRQKICTNCIKTIYKKNLK